MVGFLSELNATRLSISFSSFVNQAKNGTQAKKEKRTGSLLMKIQSFINGRSRNFDCQFAKIEGKCTAGYMIWVLPSTSSIIIIICLGRASAYQIISKGSISAWAGQGGHKIQISDQLKYKCNSINQYHGLPSQFLAREDPNTNIRSMSNVKLPHSFIKVT